MPNRAQSSYLVCFATAERAFEFRAGERRLRVLLLRDDGDSTDDSSESGDDADVSQLPAVAPPSPAHKRLGWRIAWTKSQWIGTRVQL